MKKAHDATLPRRQLVADLLAKGVIRSAPVRDAFLAVAREGFVAGVLGERGLEGVYRDEALVTKRDARGMPLSSSSQPALMAEMLELIDLRPGHRVLEIGTGSGYNAALMAHIVGRRGRVTTVDVDAELARRAKRSLRAGGWRATVAVTDGRAGLPEHAPYDRIIVTAAGDAIPRAWLEQLTPGGRVELPLRIDPDGASIQVIPVLERQGERLQSVGLTWGSFMPLHDGDGGWRPPPSSLSAGRSDRAEHASIVSLSGEGLARLSDTAARTVLAAMLVLPQKAPIAHGTTRMHGATPPLLLIYLLLKIRSGRRVSLRRGERLGIGLVDRRRRGVAVVSFPSPWIKGAWERTGRARWRLDSYAGGDAGDELEQLLGEWRELERSSRDLLCISAGGRGDLMRLGYSFSTR